MFKRRDIPSLLLLTTLFFFILMTLTQILVVHNGKFRTDFQSERKLHLELRELDLNLHSIMMQTVPSVELNRRLLQNEINSKRFLEILKEASSGTQGMSRTQSNYEVIGVSDFHQKPNMTVNENSVNSTVHSPQASRRSAASASFEHSRHNFNTRLSKTRTQSRVIDLAKTGTDSANSRLINQHLRSIPTQLSTTERDTDHFSNSTTFSNTLTHSNLNEYAVSRMSGLKLDNKSRTSDLSHATNSNYTNTDSVLAKPRKRSPAKRPRGTHISYCPAIPPNLKGRFAVDLTRFNDLSLKDILKQCPHIKRGGTWRPRDCTARHKVLVVIPYRDRWQHLITMLYYLHPLLQRQQLDYRVVVVEQIGNDTFNKARIMNIAFVESLKRYKFQCVVFHDVDLVPEDDRNMYSCPRQPRHMSVAIDEMGYKLAYAELVGGVLNMRTEHFQRVNGYSNLYWGWGAEDDDMAYRIMQIGLQIMRPPESMARYKMIKHTKRKPSDYRKRKKLLVTGTRRFQFDGLNSLSYKIVRFDESAIFTHILVDIGKPPKGFR